MYFLKDRIKSLKKNIFSGYFSLNDTEKLHLDNKTLYKCIFNKKKILAHPCWYKWRT